MNHNDSSVDIGRRLYYSSTQGPFYNANNIFMFYGGGGRGDAVENIIRALRSDEQMVNVHGERGSGKTMLSLVISDRLKQRYSIIRYDVPDFSDALLLRHLLIELLPQQADFISAEQAQEGVDQEAIDAALTGISEQLIQLSQAGTFKPILLMVDSQADMDTNCLKILETLSVLRANGHPIFQCVMFHRVSDHAAQHATRSSNMQLAAFQQTNHYWLRRLTLAEINEYLRHHMMLFDFTRRDLFTREMAYFIADRSEGVFRSINTLARNAFTIANLEDADKLSMSHLLMAGLPPRVETSIDSGFLAKHRGQMIALLGACVVASTAVAVVLLK